MSRVWRAYLVQVAVDTRVRARQGQFPVVPHGPRSVLDSRVHFGNAVHKNALVPFVELTFSPNK